MCPGYRATHRDAERADEVEIPTLAGVDTRSGNWHERAYQWKIPAHAALENNFDIHHFNFVHASKLQIMRVGARIGEVEVLPLPHGLELRVEVLADDDGRGAQEFTVEYRADVRVCSKCGGRMKIVGLAAARGRRAGAWRARRDR